MLHRTNSPIRRDVRQGDPAVIEEPESLRRRVGGYRLGRTLVLLTLGAMGVGIGLTRALPRNLDFAIRTDLGGAGQDMVFVDLGFDLAAYLALIGGALAADAFGASLVLLVSAGIAGAAGLIAAEAPSLPILILARVVAGGASGSAIAAALVAIGTTAPSPERGWATGLVLGGIVAGTWAAEPLAVSMGLWIWRSPLALISGGMAIWAGIWWAAVHRGPLAPGPSTIPVKTFGHILGMKTLLFLAFAVAWGAGYWQVLVPARLIDRWHWDLVLIPGISSLRLGTEAASCLLAGLVTDLLFWGSGNLRSARQVTVAAGLLIALVAGGFMPGIPGTALAYWLAIGDAGLALAAVGIMTTVLDIAAPRSGVAVAVLGATIGIAAWASPTMLGRLLPGDRIVGAIALALLALALPLAFLLRPDRPLPTEVESPPPRAEDDRD
jgi:hypothetical protein